MAHLGAVDEHRSAETQRPRVVPPRQFQPSAPRIGRDRPPVAKAQDKGAPASVFAVACTLGGGGKRERVPRKGRGYTCK